MDERSGWLELDVRELPRNAQVVAYRHAELRKARLRQLLGGLRNSDAVSKDMKAV
jgi:hypothetical protein